MCEEGGKKRGNFSLLQLPCCDLSKLLSERTDASLSFFLTLSGMIQRAGVDHLILRRLEENVLFIPCLRFLPRSAAHFSVDVMPLRLCDGGCCLAFYQRLRSCLDLYSKQYWSDWVNCSLLYLCGLLLLRAGFTASDICCLLMQERDREEQGVCWDSSYTIHHTRVRVCAFSFVWCPWPQPGGNPGLVTKLFYQGAGECVSPCCPAGTAILLSPLQS